MTSQYMFTQISKCDYVCKHCKHKVLSSNTLQQLIWTVDMSHDFYTASTHDFYTTLTVHNMTYITCGLYVVFRAISDHLKVIDFQKFPGAPPPSPPAGGLRPPGPPGQGLRPLDPAALGAAPPDPRYYGLRPEEQLLQIGFKKDRMYYNLHQFCTGAYDLQQFSSIPP